MSYKPGAALLAAGLLTLSVGQEKPASKSAASILQTKCIACHGATRMSDLDLRTSEAILKGGKRGPAVVPGKADASLLFKAVKREGDVHMPPGKNPLAPAEVAVLRDWINAGARIEPAKTDAAPNWWSFRKAVRPTVPTVKGAVANPIDAFILAKLEQKGLQPSPMSSLPSSHGSSPSGVPSLHTVT